MADSKHLCDKCGKEKRIQEFFLMKDGEPCNMCKDCLTMYVDNQDPETFKWILEKFDVPYIEKVWIEQYNKAYKKNPGKMGPRSVIGFYLRCMKMKQWKDYTYADTDRLNYENQKMAQVAYQKKLSEDELKILAAQLADGVISQAEYDTLTASPEQIAARDEVAFVTNFSQENEDIIAEQLGDEDYRYLLLKWGEFYRPSQWVKMEELYQKYAEEYELNADREDALLKICKVSLKLDEALDTADYQTADKLQKTYDNLRKSAKFKMWTV